jgi:hypothetical protein
MTRTTICKASLSGLYFKPFSATLKRTVMPLKAFGPTTQVEILKQEIRFDKKAVLQVLSALNPPPLALPPEEARIRVHAAVSRISVVYEKLRNAIDYRDEHLLRKSAIDRILRRQLVLEADPYLIASNLIRELIAARYLPNDTLPESLIDDTAIVIRKYQAVHSIKIGTDRYHEWLRSIISCELEELFTNPVSDKTFVSFLYQRLSERIGVKGMTIPDPERRLHIYVACYRMVMKADDDQVSYKYVRAFVLPWMHSTEWFEYPYPVAEELYGAYARIQQILRSRLTQRFLRAVRPYAVSLWMLRAALEQEEEPGKLLDSREETQKVVGNVVGKREAQARGKLWRGTIRAMIYLLITKVVFALLLEVPVEQLVYGDYSRTALAINISLPPVIMLFIGIFIHRPGVANRRKILEYVDALLVPAGPSRQEISAPRQRVGASAFFSFLLYVVMYGISFGLIGYWLIQLHFTSVAIIIFFFFLCIVSFFGYRLRLTAQEMIVLKPKERLLTAIMDFLTLPILHAGRWLSVSISKINIFAFIFDVIFEAPLKLFLGVMEESLKFIKEKKDELTE